jgi:hypothetical protein
VGYIRILEVNGRLGDQKRYVFYRSGKPNPEKIEWLARQPEVIKWIRKHPSLAEARSQTVLYYIHDFLEYLTVDEGSPLRGCGSFEAMLDRIEDLRPREQQKVADYLFGFIDAMEVGPKSKRTYYSHIRSLFKFGIHAMVFPQSERLPWTENRSPLAQDNELRREDFLAIMGRVDDPLWRSVFWAKAQANFGVAELIQFNEIGWKLIGDQYMKGESLNGRKGCAVFIMPPRPKVRDRGALPYPTSLERDAMRELRVYLEDVRGVPRVGEPIWLTAQGNPITPRSVRDAWMNYIKKSGVVKTYAPTCPKCGGRLRLRKPLLEDGSRPHFWLCKECRVSYRRSELTGEPEHRELSRIRYRFDLHEASRDLMASEMENACYRTGAPIYVIDLRLGHTAKVDANGYKKCMQKNLEWAEEIFELISPWLNMGSVDPYKVSFQDYKKLQKQNEELTKRMGVDIVEIRAELEKLQRLREQP